LKHPIPSLPRVDCLHLKLEYLKICSALLGRYDDKVLRLSPELECVFVCIMSDVFLHEEKLRLVYIDETRDEGGESYILCLT